jgi:hypothetical protein
MQVRGRGADCCPARATNPASREGARRWWLPGLAYVPVPLLPRGLHTLERQSTQAHCLHLVANAIVYWNTIYIQRALDDLGHEPDSDELDGLTPTLFEHVNPLGTYDFNTDRPAGQLRPLRAASAA